MKFGNLLENPINKYWHLTIVLISLILVATIHWINHNAFFSIELVFAWLLAYLNHFIGWQIKNKGMGNQANRFVIFTVGLSGLRLLILMAILLFIITYTKFHIFSFVSSFFIVYFIFMCFDIFIMHSLAKNNMS